MIFKTYKPAKHLAGLVKYYWSLDATFSATEMYIHRTLANHCPEIIFHYASEFKEIIAEDNIEKTFRTGIHGQTNKIRRFTSKDGCGIFGVMLQPYAIPILFNIPATALANELVDLVSLLGQKGKDITEQIILANDNTQRIILMNNFLTSFNHEAEQPEIIRAVQFICSEKGNVSIQKLSNQSFLSIRQFERKFKDLVGFSPKAFSRLVRFKSIVDNYSVQNKTLTEIGYDFGYYDQSHFIQDFRQFSGYNPKTYFGGNANEVFYAPR